jgi:hypothetical protein
LEKANQLLQDELDGKATIATFNITIANTTITLKNLTGMTNIDWGDGVIDNKLEHIYNTKGTYVCKIYDVTSIGDYAFRNCSSLTSVEIGDSVTSIGSYAFLNRTDLTSVVIGNGVTTIGYQAFAYNPKLVNVIIGKNVKTIGEQAFYSCGVLTNIDLGQVETIERNAFQATALTSIVIPETVTSMGNNVFNGLTTLKRVEYKASLAIPYSTFFKCTGLTDVVLSNSLKGIGGRAFYGCTFLKSVVIPDSVTTIDENAFYGNTNLTIYCEATNKPNGWDDAWNPSNRPVIWEYKSKDYPEVVTELNMLNSLVNSNLDQDFFNSLYN